MFLKAKTLALLGLLLAFSVLMVIFSAIFEFNTLFLLAAAGICVGIAIRETGQYGGTAFYIASVLLSLMLSPNKLYALTYSGMGLYIVIVSYITKALFGAERKNDRSLSGKRLSLWLIKLLVFNLVYLPFLYFAPTLIYTGKLNYYVYAGLIIGGQVLLVVFDRAYWFFMWNYWEKYRNRLL